jgi:DNA-binding NarL/FixJ family response regulator
VVAKECVSRKKTTDVRTRTELSARERQVLQLIAEGKSSKEIGRTLELEESTVVVHRRNISSKLKLHSIAELTRYAIQEGITILDTSGYQ